MATIIEYDGKQYLITCSTPESEWITMIAKSLGMTKETVIGAALNQGLCHYVGMLTQIAEHELGKDQIQPEITDDIKEAKDETPKKTIDDDACDDIC